MIATLLALAGIFGELSLLAFGGGNSILPEMQRQVVEVHPWMSAAEFTALYGLAQASPGPNLMVVTLVGWRVAGLPGALVSTIATFAPSSLLTSVGLVLWHRFRHAPWRRAIQVGLVPVTAGLVAAGALLIARSADTSWLGVAITLAVAAITLRTKVHPLILLGSGAVLGVLLLR
jgi:chromate transporter